MSEPPSETTQTPPRPPSVWRRWGWRILVSCGIAIAVAGYYAHRRGQVAGFVVWPRTGKGGPVRPLVYLPRVGSLESFRKDQGPARAICRRLALPELPDITGIDPDGQKQFYYAFVMLRSEPRNHDRYGLLGQLCEAQRFPELAAPFYRRAIEMAPEDYEWHYALALRLVKDGQSEAADAEFRLAGERKPDYAPVWIQRARRAVERGETQRALEFVNRYIALRPDDPFGYVQRAQVHLEGNQWEAMDKDLQEARRLGPIGKQGHRLLGALHQHRNESEDARVHLLMSAEEQPGGEMDDPVGIMVRRLETFREPLLTKLSGLVGSRRYAEAVELADEIFARYKEHPDFGVICGKLAESYRQLGNLPKAVFYAQQARDALPNQAAPYAELALLFLDGGSLTAAMQAADKALAIDPELHVALYARGIARIQMAIQAERLPPGLRQADPPALVRQAADDLEKCLRKKPVQHPYLVALATAHGMLAHFDRAGELLATALRIVPDDRDALALRQKATAKQSFWPANASPR